MENISGLWTSRGGIVGGNFQYSFSEEICLFTAGVENMTEQYGDLREEDPHMQL